MAARMAILSATNEEHIQIVTKCQTEALKMTIISAITNHYLQIVTNSQADGGKYIHNVNNY